MFQTVNGGIEPKPAPNLSRTPGVASDKRLPLVGEHTVDIMQSLGYSSQDIQKFIKENVIGQQMKGSL